MLSGFSQYLEDILLYNAWRYESQSLHWITLINNLGIHPPLATLVAWSKISNPSHPSETRGWELVTLVVILFSTTLVTVIARLWARIKIQHNAGIDDIIVFAAMVSSIPNKNRMFATN